MPSFLVYFINKKTTQYYFREVLKTIGTEIAIWTKPVVQFISFTSLTAAEPKIKDCFSL